MREKPFYSIWTGKNVQEVKLNFQQLCKLFVSPYNGWDFEGYYQEYFGYECVDAGAMPGNWGETSKVKLYFR
jgi:hypothetical protein